MNLSEDTKINLKVFRILEAWGVGFYLFMMGLLNFLDYLIGKKTFECLTFGPLEFFVAFCGITILNVTACFVALGVGKSLRNS